MPRSLLISLTLLLTTCLSRHEEIPFPYHKTEYDPPVIVKIPDSVPFVKATPTFTSLDTMPPPRFVKAGKPGFGALGAADNFVPAGEPVFTPAGESDFTPVDSPVFIPLTKAAMDSAFVPAGTPEKKKFIPPSMRENATHNIKYFSQDQGIPGTVVYCLLQDRYGRIWVGTDNGLVMMDGENLYVYTTRQGLSNNFINRLLEDDGGRVWIGTSGGGVNVYDPGRNGFQHFTESQGLSNNYVSSLLEDDEGRVWIGTSGGGVNVYDPERNGFLAYTTSQGLNNNDVRSLLEDAWLYGYMVIWLYGYMVIWLYGYMVIWLYGYMVIWLYG